MQGEAILEKQTTLKQGKMETYKALLTQKINELLSEAGKTVTEMTNGKENYPDPYEKLKKLTNWAKFLSEQSL